MIIALGLAAALSAQTPPPPAPPRVERDVRIVRVEGSEGGPGGMSRLDKDTDGFISREEYVGPTTEAFRVLDKDNDGRISAAELAEGRSVARTILGEGGGPGRVQVFGGPGGAMFSGRSVGPAGPDGPMTFTMRREGGEGGPPTILRLGEGQGPGDLDKDKDGKVSEEEFLASLRDVFRTMDKDGSGALEDGERGTGSGVRVFTRRIERPAD